MGKASSSARSAVSRRPGAARADKTVRLTVADFPPPRAVSDADLKELGKTFRIPPTDQPALTEFLTELITVFADEVIRDRRQPDFRADRDRLKKALSAVKQAHKALAQPFRPAVRRSLDAFGSGLGPVVSAKWLRDRFPDDELTPKPQALPIDPQADPERYPGLRRLPKNTTRFDIERLSINARVSLVEARPAETVVALLQEIQNPLQVALHRMTQLPEARGGQKPVDSRRYVLINLAAIWSRLGRHPTGGATSDFVAFCEAFFELIGWPGEGLQHAVPRAIRSWRDRGRKIAR